jgi:hypothetical protein
VYTAPVSGEDDAQDDALRAIQERIARVTLYLIGGPRPKLPTGLGSATLLETPRGRLVALTARHVLEGPRSLVGGVRIGWHECSDTSEALVPRYIAHPDPRRDVALFEIPDELTPTLRHLAASTSSVVAWQPPSDRDENIMVSGFPDQLTSHVMETPRRAAFGYACVCYFAQVRDLRREADGRLRLSWTLMELFDGPGRHDLPKPAGMSGGALWFYDGSVRVPTNVVWTPWNALRLVGIPIEWSEDLHCLRFDPSNLWASWFRAAITDIDRHQSA